MTETWLGLGSALVEPLLDPGSRTFWPALVLGALVALLVAGWRGLGLAHWRSASSRLDLQLFLVRRLLDVLGAVPQLGSALGLAAFVSLGLQRSLGTPSLPALPDGAVVALYSVVIFLAWDASRYLLHRLLHEVPALWAFHQVHHSAEVLTPLTYFRVHPVEAWLYALRGVAVTGVVAGVFAWAFREQAAVWTVLGVHGLGFVFSTLSGNLRHSHVRLSFGPLLEGWLVSPAQHQLHHSVERAGQSSNFGTWLAVWDRMAGSLRRSDPDEVVVFGLDRADRDHELDLVSSLLHPFVGLLPRRLSAAVAVLLMWGVARADEPTEPASAEGTDDSEDPLDDLATIVVRADGGAPRTPGSAHVVDEEELERQEHDDIHRIVAAVPGVYVRGEDGFGLRPNIGIRGANSDRSAKISLMEDGVLFGPAPYAAPAAYYFPMSTRMVGVEVFKGAAATQYGPNTVGGVLNLVTRSVPTNGVDWAADIAGGPRRTGKLHGWIGVGDDRGGVLLEGVHLSTDGFKHLPSGGPTGFVRQEGMLKARLLSDPDRATQHTLGLKLGGAREISNETYLGLTEADFEVDPYQRYAASELDRMQWHRLQAELSHEVHRGDALSVRTVAYYHDLDRQWFKLNSFAGGPAIGDLLAADGGGQAAVYTDILRGEQDSVTADQRLMIGTNDRRFRASGLQTRAVLTTGEDGWTSRLDMGARLHLDDVVRVHTQLAHDMVDGMPVAADLPLETTLDSHDQALAGSAHVHEDLALGPVRVLAGSRVEVIRTSHRTRDGLVKEAQTRAVLLPGAAVHAQPNDWLGVFGGVHRGFSPVAPGQAADVRPELSWNTEAGMRAQRHASRVELIGFFDDYSNIAGQCTFSGGCADDQVGQQYNGGSAIVWGAEALAAGERPLRWGEVVLDGQLTYTYTDTRFRTDFVSGFPQYGRVSVGDRFPYVPQHQAAGRLTVDSPRASLTTAATWRSSMRDSAGAEPLDAQAAPIPAVLIVDLAGDVRLSEQVRLYGTLGNALNATYISSWRPFGARPGRPRQAMVGLKITPPSHRESDPPQ